MTNITREMKLRYSHPPLIFIRAVLLQIVLFSFSTGVLAANERGGLWQTAVPMINNKTIDNSFRSTSSYSSRLGNTNRSSVRANYNYRSSNLTSYQSGISSYGSSELHRSSAAVMKNTGANIGNGGTSYGHYSSNTTFRDNAASFTNLRKSTGVVVITDLSSAKTLLASNSTRKLSSLRRVYVSGVSTEDGAGNYWDEEEEAWLPIPGGDGPNIGDTKVEDGVEYVYNGTEWVPNGAEPEPIEGMPIMMLVAMATAYIFYKKRKTAVTE